MGDLPIAIGLLVLIAFLIAPAKAEFEPGVEADGGIWALSLSGSFRAGTLNSIGTYIDLDRVLGLDQSVVAPLGRITWRPWSRHRFAGDYTSFSMSNTRQITEQFTFNNTVYTIGTSVVSDLDVDLGSFQYLYSVYQSERTEVGLGLGLRYMSVATKLSATGIGAVSEQVDLPVPVLGVDVNTQFTDRFGARGEVFGMSVDIEGTKGSLVDARLLLRYDVTSHIALSGGYRYLSLSAEGDGDEASINLSGPTAFLGVRF